MRKIASLAIAALACLFVVSCGKKDDPAAVAASGKLFTDATLTPAQMVARSADPGYGFIANNPEFTVLSYAEINEAQLASAMARYRAWLFRSGIPISEVSGGSGWNPRFNCAFFSEALVVFLGCELFGEKFQSFSDAARPAAFVVYYQPRWSDKPHAIVQVVCAGRSLYIEPQDTRGAGEVKLTPEEAKTVYRRRA